GAVGERLPTRLDLPYLAGQAAFREPRRRPARPAELLVPAAAETALRDDDARVRTREVGDELVSLEHLSAYGHREHRVLAARAVRETVATPSATARPELLVRP